MIRKRQTGSAILAAIFVVAIVALISTAIYRLAHQPLQSTLLKQQDLQYQFLLDSAVVDAEQQLKTISTLPQPIQFSSQANGQSAQVTVTSPQWLLNANTFSKLNASELTEKTDQLSRFFEAIGLEHPHPAAEALIAALNHSLISAGNSTDLYEWPGNPWVIPSSIRSLPNLSTDDYRLLRHWLTVLPPGTAYIPQMDQATVLMAYGLSKKDSEKVARCLRKQGSRSLSTTLTQCQLTDKTSSQALAKLISDSVTHYFTIQAVLVLNNSTVQRTTLLYRNGKRWYVVWQHNNWNE